MVKVVLIYGSTTGNTEALSEHVAAGLERGMAEVTVKDVAKARLTNSRIMMRSYSGAPPGAKAICRMISLISTKRWTGSR